MDEIGDILPQFVKRHVRGERAPVIELLAPLWPRVAGKAMAQQARPVAFAAGTLTLATANPSWATELRALQEQIRSKVNGALGRPLVKRLKVRFDPRLVENFAPEIVRQSPLPAGAPALGLAEPSLTPEIRAVLTSSFAKYFSRDKGRVN